MWDLTIYPSWGPASSLAHRLVSGSDTIRNSSSQPLVDIVHFCPLHIAVNLTILKHIWKGFHTLIRNISFPSPTHVGYHIVVQDNDFISLFFHRSHHIIYIYILKIWLTQFGDLRSHHIQFLRLQEHPNEKVWHRVWCLQMEIWPILRLIKHG